MSVHVSTVRATGGTYSATVERVSDGYYFNPTSQLFQTGLTYSQKKTLMVEGSNENAGSYTASISNVSGPAGTSDPGLVRIRIHNESAANATVEIVEGYVVANDFIRVDESVAGRADASAVATAISDAILTDVAIPELDASPPAEPTIAEAIGLIFMAMRNRSTSTSTRLKIHNSTGTPIAEAALSDDGSTFTRAALETSV